MNAVATKSRGKAARRAVVAESRVAQRLAEPLLEKPSPTWLTFDLRDKLLKGLHSSRAVLSVLTMVFANEPRFEQPKKDIAGLMGVLQYAQRQLHEIQSEVMERGDELDELYWSTFGASSMVSLLEEIEWAESFQWQLDEGLVCDYLTAAYDCIETAIDFLEASEVRP